jgi:hypothetical protein
MDKMNSIHKMQAILQDVLSSQMDGSKSITIGEFGGAMCTVPLTENTLQPLVDVICVAMYDEANDIGLLDAIKYLGEQQSEGWPSTDLEALITFKAYNYDILNPFVDVSLNQLPVDPLDYYDAPFFASDWFNKKALQRLARAYGKDLSVWVK